MTAFRFSRTLVAGVPALALLLASAPFAALADDDAPPRDPGVARVSVARGDVAVKRADSGDTVTAAVNAPLSEGDYLSTQDDSHAEVQFDYGTNLRIGDDTQVRFVRLDPGEHDVELAAGTVELRVFRGLDAGAQIETPQATIRPRTGGSTIVNVDDAGNAQVSVRDGSAEISTEAGTQTLQSGATVAIAGDSGDVRIRSIASVSYGAFDAWIAGRDRAFAHVDDYRYVDAGMVGAQDLYGNGRWVDYPQYGNVWVPAVATGWAPYHDGRWVWEPYYGWTWVDREPWGWAPFHYGNWFYADDLGGWAWYPGAPEAARPYVYRPALVAFFDFGGGSDLSVGFGNVGWVPIAPFEPFHPWWNGREGYDGGGRGPTIVNRTTIVNNYTITKVYRNAGAPGGATGVPSANFQNGNFTNLRVLESGDLASARPVRDVVPIVPTTHNLAFGTHVRTSTIVPVERFSAFHPIARPVPSFELQRETIRATATQAYPAHADTIERPVPVDEMPRDRSAAPVYRTTPRYDEPQRQQLQQQAQPADQRAFGRDYPRTYPRPDASPGPGTAVVRPVRVRRPRPRVSPTPAP